MVHYCSPIPVARLTAKLATVTAERDNALAKLSELRARVERATQFARLNGFKAQHVAAKRLSESLLAILEGTDEEPKEATDGR